MQQFIATLKKYAVFQGRATRKEYWNYALFNFLFIVLFGIVDSAILFIFKKMGLFTPLFTLATFLPGLALTSRRMHDLNKSGWMILINFIPIIGSIWFFILTIKVGDEGENQFGPHPNQPEESLPSLEAQHFEATVNNPEKTVDAIDQGQVLTTNPMQPAVAPPQPIPNPEEAVNPEIPAVPQTLETEPVPAMLNKQVATISSQEVKLESATPLAPTPTQELPALSLENNNPQV